MTDYNIKEKLKNIYNLYEKISNNNSNNNSSNNNYLERCVF